MIVKRHPSSKNILELIKSNLYKLIGYNVKVGSTIYKVSHYKSKKNDYHFSNGSKNAIYEYYSVVKFIEKYLNDENNYGIVQCLNKNVFNFII